MGPNQKRIERAWKQSKDWITEFDGSATKAYLTNVNTERLPNVFSSLAEQSENFRVSIISGEDEELSQFIQPELIQNNIDLLLKNEIAGLNINYLARLDDFDLDVHMVLVTIGKQKVDLEIVWWADEVFPEDIEPFNRFSTLINYFISLQNLFQSPKLFIGPETLEKPGPGSISWIEV